MAQDSSSFEGQQRMHACIRERVWHVLSPLFSCEVTQLRGRSVMLDRLAPHDHALLTDPIERLFATDFFIEAMVSNDYIAALSIN